MTTLLHDLVFDSAKITPEASAIEYKDAIVTYSELGHSIDSVAKLFNNHGLKRSERVAVYLDKCLETVLSIFGTSRANGVFVPVNPVLKPEQVAYILTDCNVRILITSSVRLRVLIEVLPSCHDLRTIIITDKTDALPALPSIEITGWKDSIGKVDSVVPEIENIDSDMAAILYTSGSTGKPKGVVLSHRNIVMGAKSVSIYLRNTKADRILTVLPFSFDYGLSQLTTAFLKGATVVLFNYLLARDVIKAIKKYRITGLAAVPPLWVQLSQLEWLDDAIRPLRYITNSGGALPSATLSALRSKLRDTDVYLMYGLTEAFRSTYLPPSEIDNRPGSMGKAIPNAEVVVVDEDGNLCEPGEPGELVHRGVLVAMGYWGDPERTAERFKFVPNPVSGITIPEYAVWSGDTVRMDKDGYLYFIGRQDDMIKTSGYRVSPSEVEDIIYSSGLVNEVAAIGIPHPVLGQAIIVFASLLENNKVDQDRLDNICKEHLPAYMIPARYELKDNLPHNPNGKIDRKRLYDESKNIFSD